MEHEVKETMFKRPYLIVEKIFERIALACDKKLTGRVDGCSICADGTQYS